MLLDFRKPTGVVLEECVSYSGLYWIALMIHYVKGKPCWDVVASRKTDGLITRRHYSEDTDNIAPEACAKRFWEDKFKPRMLAAPVHEEEDSLASDVFKHLGIREGIS